MSHPNPDCPECDGEGQYDTTCSWSSDGITTIVCECTLPSDDEAYDAMKDAEAEAYFERMSDRD